MNATSQVIRIRALGRRALVSAMLATCAAPSASAQSPPRVAILSTSREASAQLARTIRARLRELGFVEGRDVAFTIVSADNRLADLPRLVGEIVRERAAVIVASGAAVARAVRDGAPETPTVAFAGELVAMGLARSYAKPGGMITGVSFIGDDLNAKRLEILAELVARPARVLQLADSASGSLAPDITDAARRLGLELKTIEAGDPEAIDRAIAEARSWGAVAINVLASPRLNAHRRHIIARAAEARLPAIYQWPETAQDGGLIAYGPPLLDMYRQLGSLVARILRGTPPGEIPIEQPTRFDLVINLRAAAAIGLTVPPTLIALADEVIE